MSLEKKCSRKSLSFLTPQSQKTQSSKQRLSFSVNGQSPEHLLENLLNNPLKRALLIEVLSQESPKTNQNGVKDVGSKTNKKFKYESPSALCRRRALAKMQATSDSSNVNNNISHKLVKVPFDTVLKGVTAYVEIMSHGKDRSAGVKSLMQAMGADIRDVFSRDLTHVVFKDGSFKTYQKARLLKVHLVSVLWIDAARRHECRMPEKDYPALGSNASNVNVSLICQEFQRDYEDVLQEELNRSKKLSILPDVHSEDIIDTSQVCNDHLVKNITKDKHPVTPDSMYLDSTPDITPDSDSENYSTANKKLFKEDSKKFENGVSTNVIDAEQNSKYVSTNLSNFDNKLSGTCSQTEELSSLRISTNSNSMTNKQQTSQAVLDYKNITQRKKSSDKKNKVIILEQHILEPNMLSSTEANCEKELDKNVENNNILEQEITYNTNLTQDTNSKKILKKTMRTLYNANDADILICDQNIDFKSTNKVSLNSGDESDKNSIKNSHTKKSENKKEVQSDVLNRKSCFKTPKSLNGKCNSKMKESVTIPRRRSSRLLQNQNSESPQKKPRRNTIDEDLLCYNSKTDEDDFLLVTRDKQISNSVNNDELHCKVSSKSKNTVKKTYSKSHCNSRRTLNFGTSSSKNSPLKNNKSILLKNDTINTPGGEKQNDDHTESKNTSCLKSTRKSERISNFQNVSIISNLKPLTYVDLKKKSPQNKCIINNIEKSNKENAVKSNEEKKFEENNIDSSDEFIYKRLEIRKSNDNKEHSDNFLNESCFTKKKLNVSNSNDDGTMETTFEKKDFENTQNDVERSYYKLRRSTADFIPKEPIQTQNRFKDNTLNSKLKFTQRNKLHKKTSVVCTRFHSTEVQVFQKIVKKLGVFFVEDEVTEKTTHLVAAEPRRTVNLLRAIARGCWILKSEWLYRSLEAGHWLSEEDYELCDFSNAVQKSRQERQAFGAKFSVDIFQNCGRIYISRGTNPRCSDLQELLTLCKGTITTITRNADVIVGEYIENKTCVSVNWIMDSITFYRRKSLKNYIIDPPTSD